MQMSTLVSRRLYNKFVVQSTTALKYWNSLTGRFMESLEGLEQEPQLHADQVLIELYSLWMVVVVVAKAGNVN